MQAPRYLKGCNASVSKWRGPPGALSTEARAQNVVLASSFVSLQRSQHRSLAQPRYNADLCEDADWPQGCL